MEVKSGNLPGLTSSFHNKAALRRMNTLIRHIDPPAKHYGLRCQFRFQFWFYFGFHNIA